MKKKKAAKNRPKYSLFTVPVEKQKHRSYHYALVVNERDTKYFQTKEAAEAAAAKLSGEIRKIENYKIKKVA
jgi:hypothetical protein